MKTAKLIECKNTMSGLREAKPLEADAQGRKRYDVTILSVGQGNRRDKNYYPIHCIQNPQTAKAFEGKPCYLNHPSLIEDESQPERTVEKKAGWFSNVRAEGQALKAVLTQSLRPSGDLLEAIVQDCIEYSKQYENEDFDGISVNAFGESEPVTIDGEDWNQVNVITEAESADVVTRAGRGGRFDKKLEAFLKESKGGTMKTKKELAEASSADKKTAFMHAANTFKAAAEAAEDPANKALFMKHAENYMEMAEGKKKEDDTTDPEDKKDGGVDDAKEAEAKEAEAKKEEEAKKEAATKEAKTMEEKDKKIQTLEAELRKVQIEKRLSESGLPEVFQKSVRLASVGRELVEVDEFIKLENEKLQYTVQEAGSPARLNISEDSTKAPLANLEV